jgi:phosphodiesterase/alkaline phosphatase D-like protein
VPQHGIVKPRTAVGPIYPQIPRLTSEQLKAQEEELNEVNMPPELPGERKNAPPVNPPTESAPDQGGAIKSTLAPAAANDFAYRTVHDLSPTEASNTRSVIGEPSVGSMGNTIFYTGNWYAARSIDGGQTFTYVNPYNTFPNVNNGFCCDQIVNYAPNQDMIIWALQYVKDLNSGTLRIARAVGSAAVASNTWLYYDFNPQQFGFATGNWFDFPNMTVSDNYLYITSNVYSTANDLFAGSVIWRIRLSELAAGGSINYDSLARTDVFALRCADGAHTTMYWGALLSTTQVRIHRWDDASGSTIFWDDVNINSYIPLSRDGVATSPDGTNWAARADSRIGGAWVSGGVIGLTWHAKQGGTFPYPYSIIARFNEANRALISQTPIWNPQFAWLYPTSSVNAAGNLAGLVTSGGGASYPATNIWISDDVQNGFNPLALYGATSSNVGPTSNTWGDYHTVRRHKDSPNTWVASTIYLQNSGGNVVPRYLWFGRERDFPAAAPSPPTANPASNVTSSGFTANWSNSSGATGYRLDVSTSSSFSSYVIGYQDLDVGNVTSRTVSGTSANTTYYYRLRAYNGAGTSGSSNVINVVTSITSPSAPNASLPTNITSSAFTANWGAVSGASGYRLDVSTSSSFNSYVSGYQDLDLGNVTSRAVSGLSANTTYYYRVRAYNNAGTSGNSNSISAKTNSLPPSAPTANPASNVTSSGFTANWNNSSGATGYRLDVSTSNSFSSYVSGFQDLDAGNVTSRNVSGLSANTTYYYRLRAYNGAGTSGSSNVVSLTTSTNSPLPPTVNSAINITSSGFTANWIGVSGATGYRLDVSISSSFSGYTNGYQNLDVGNVTSRSVSGLSANTTYYYRVRAYNSGGTSGNSNTITVVTQSVASPNDQCSDAIALSIGATNALNTASSTSIGDPVPSCQSNFGNGVWYNFTPPTNGTVTVSTCGSDFDTVLQIYTGGCGALTPLTGGCDDDNGPDCQALQASVSFPGTAGTTYWILVGGYRSAGGNLQVVARMTGNAPSAPTANTATNATSGGFTANWSNASGATGYRLDVSTSNSFSSYVPGYQDLNVGNVTSQNVSGLSANTTYYYRLRAYNGTGTSGNSNVMMVTTNTSPPFAPAANAATNVTSGGFTANWSAVTGASGYRLDVSMSSSFGNYLSGYQDLDVNAATSQNVSGLSSNTTYYYRVRSYNGAGSSGNSNFIAVTTPAPGTCNPLTEGFDDITSLPGWVMQNNSQSIGTSSWFQGNPAVFTSQSGTSDSYIGVNFDSGAGIATISNWLFTPPLILQNGARLTFYTRTVDTPQYPDRLQVRLSLNGSSANVGTTATSVGDFATLLLDINSTYSTSGYPNAWTQFTVTLSGIGAPTTGRLAFRYFVENGGPSGANSNYVGIDTIQYSCGGPVDPPTVQTLTATSIGTTSAVINGTVTNAGGSVVDQRFFYYWDGVNPAIGIDDAAITRAGNNFYAQVAGLNAGTTYYFKAYAHNSSPTDLGGGPGWGSGASSSFITLNSTAAVATPVISPNGSTFKKKTTVTLFCATPGAKIYYTLNGTDPSTASAAYQLPFKLNSSVTVKAKAIKAGSNDSPIASAIFTKRRR